MVSGGTHRGLYVLRGLAEPTTTIMTWVERPNGSLSGTTRPTLNLLCGSRSLFDGQSPTPDQTLEVKHIDRHKSYHHQSSAPDQHIPHCRAALGAPRFPSGFDDTSIFLFRH